MKIFLIAITGPGSLRPELWRRGVTYKRIKVCPVLKEADYRIRSRLSQPKQKRYRPYSEVLDSDNYPKGGSKRYYKELGDERSGWWRSEASRFSDREHRNTYCGYYADCFLL